MMINKKFQGFTLIEIVLVVGILSFIALAAGQILAKSFQSYATLQNLNITSLQSKVALESMSRRIRRIASPSNITQANGISLTFTEYEPGSSLTTKTNTVNYTLSGNTLMFNSSQFSTTAQYPMLVGVTNLTFTYADRNGAATTVLADIRFVNISLTISQNSINRTIQTTINLRNLQ